MSLNLPNGATCSYSPTTGALTISTLSATPAGTYVITVIFTETLPGAETGLIVLPVLLLPFVFARKKLMARGVFFGICLAFILMAGATFAIGCGGGGSGSTPVVPPTNPTHQVTSLGVVSLTVQ